MVMDIGTLLSWWEGIGVFDYLLPFLLIFAVIYGILTASNILSENKGVNVVIAMVVGLLALRLGYVQSFFTEVFPRLGVGIAVLFVLLILTGLFVGKENLKVMFWIFIAVGIVIAIIVLSGSFSAFGWGYNWYESDMAFWVVSIVLLIGVIVVVVMGKSEPGKAWETPFGKIRFQK